MTTDLSQFLQCAIVEKISDGDEYNYRVNVDGCVCEVFGNLIVTASTEMEAAENAWLHIIMVREETINRD